MKKKTDGPLYMFYKSTQELKWCAFAIFCFGMLVATVTLIYAWPNTIGNAIWLGFNMMICFFEVTVSLFMALLICVFADMLDCFRNMQENVNEVCATLKQESKTEESFAKNADAK